MQLIRDILAMIDTAKVDGLGNKMKDVGKDEKVLGTLSDELQRFCVVMTDMAINARNERLELEKKDEEAESVPNPEVECQCSICNGAIDSIDNRFKTVEDMFWGAVLRAIPGAFRVEHIGLRKGFQVVSCPPDEDEMTTVQIPLTIELTTMLRR
jgi:hypothetical protein